jgi:hypothetical protein
MDQAGPAMCFKANAKTFFFQVPSFPKSDEGSNDGPTGGQAIALQIPP